MTFRRPLLTVLAIAGALVAGCGGGTPGAPSDRPASTDPADELPQAPETFLHQRGVRADTWKTDFSRHSVPLGEFLSGGPPRDGIPPIDDPRPVAIPAADDWLDDREPVLVVEANGQARAYPVQILVWHEIVNDNLGGQPIAVTYCPLCNSSLVFERELDGVGLLRFGTTGNLRHSDLVMWDDRTESWWQQITGEAVVGELTGTPAPSAPLADAQLDRLQGPPPRR